MNIFERLIFNALDAAHAEKLSPCIGDAERVAAELRALLATENTIPKRNGNNIVDESCVFQKEVHDVRLCTIHGGCIDQDSYSEMHGHSWGDIPECKCLDGKPCVLRCAEYHKKHEMNDNFERSIHALLYEAYGKPETVEKTPRVIAELRAALHADGWIEPNPAKKLIK